MNRLGIELLSVFGMNPVEHVELAADPGCGFISIGLTQLPFNPHGYAPWSLRDDPALRRRLIAVMRDRGVSISLGEGFTIRSGAKMVERAADMDIMAELGAACAGASTMEPDASRTAGECAVLAELAAQRGMIATIELVPASSAGTLEAALAIVRQVNQGLEVPMLAQAEAGILPKERLQPVVDTARALLYAFPARFGP
jgi:hypothetical protein